MFVMRMSGIRFQPSARIAPPERRPMPRRRLATGRGSRRRSPSWTSGTAWAATPSSSQPNVPIPPGAVASATMSTSVRAVAEARLELVGGQEARPRVGWPRSRRRGRARSGDRSSRGPGGRAARGRGRSSAGRAGTAARREAATASVAIRSAVPARSSDADVLVAGALPSAARIGVAAALVLVAVDGVRLDPGPDVGDHLLREAAVAGGERLLLALGAVGRVGEGDPVDSAHRLVRGEQVADLLLQGDRERVLRGRGLEPAVGRWPIVEDHGPAHGRGAGPGDPDGLGGDSIGFDARQTMRGRESPRAIDEDANAEALRLVAQDSGQPAALDVDRLLAAADDADVGVRRPAQPGGVERPVGDLVHAASVPARGLRRRPGPATLAP